MSCCAVNAWGLRTNLKKRSLSCIFRHFSVAERIPVRMLFPSDHYYVTSAHWAYETGKSRTLLNAFTRVRPWHFFFSRILEILSYIRWLQVAMFILRRLWLWKLNRMKRCKWCYRHTKSSTLTTEQVAYCRKSSRLHRHRSIHNLWFISRHVQNLRLYSI